MDENVDGARTEIAHVKLGDDTVIQVEIREPEGDRDVSLGTMDFSAVTSSIESIARDLAGAINRVKPDKASIEFGVEVGVETGKLVAFLVKGTGKANLKVTLTWGK